MSLSNFKTNGWRYAKSITLLQSNAINNLEVIFVSPNRRPEIEHNVGSLVAICDDDLVVLLAQNDFLFLSGSYRHDRQCTDDRWSHCSASHERHGNPTRNSPSHRGRRSSAANTAVQTWRPHCGIWHWISPTAISECPQQNRRITAGTKDIAFIRQ